jgi:phage-related protein
MRVYGTGELGVGDGTISILQASGYIDIDFEEQEAYKDDYSVNCNENIYVAGHDFPVLHPGPNTITLGQGITRVDLKSRWWKI